MEKEPYRPGLSQDKTLVEQLRELQKNPNSLIFAALAERYRTKGLVRQALEILEEGLARHPDFAPALVAQARCYFDLRRFADCLEILGTVLRRNPDNIKAEKLRADVFQRLGQKRAAMGALTRVIALAPNDRNAVKALEELRNIDAPVAVAEAAPSRAPEAPLFAFNSSDAPPTMGLVKDFEVMSVGETQIPAEQNIAARFESAPVQVSVPAPEVPPVITARDSVAESWDEEDEAESGGDFADMTFATRTVAELYLRQGLREKAKRVLSLMLQKDPADAWVRESLQKLSPTTPTNGKNQVSQAKRTQQMLKAQFLERLLDRMRGARRASYEI